MLDGQWIEGEEEDGEQDEPTVEEPRANREDLINEIGITDEAREEIFGFGEEDVSDLVDVSYEDIMGEERLQPRRRVRPIHRERRGINPGMGGMQV